MTKVRVRSYLSPTLVLLAFDWPDGAFREDFLGFAIERQPGFGRAAKSWLPNRIGFQGPAPDQRDQPSNQAPIQKFMWWDARIDTPDRGKEFTYRVVPMVGAPGALQEVRTADTMDTCRIPQIVEHDISSYFNRAVVSSQAFARAFPQLDTMARITAARTWLANGMEQAIPAFLEAAHGKSVAGAIYHLTDDLWIIPSLTNYAGELSLVYHHTSHDTETDPAIQTLITAGQPAANFHKRTKANIMHNKFLVRVQSNHAEAVLMGSANFTPGGLTAQANLIHTFESPQLAELYRTRQQFLAGDPTKANTQAQQQGWSAPIEVGDATVRVIYPPEQKPNRVSITTIINAIEAAEHSVIFCCFTPTDQPLLEALFRAGDEGKMMFGLVNAISDDEPDTTNTDAASVARIEIYHRSRENRDVMAHSAFTRAHQPEGFLVERVLWPGEDPRQMVRIHHKFIVIDAETESPIIFTGSANMSNNALYNNDENLLEISHSPRLAAIYFAEFLRLYEHYRARVAFERFAGGQPETFKLTPDARWARKYYVPGAPESKARLAMARDPHNL